VIVEAGEGKSYGAKKKQADGSANHVNVFAKSAGHGYAQSRA
jgi:hypothetical protein